MFFIAQRPENGQKAHNTLTIPSPGEMTEACTDVGEVISPVESYNDPYKDAKATGY